MRVIELAGDCGWVIVAFVLTPAHVDIVVSNVPFLDMRSDCEMCA